MAGEILILSTPPGRDPRSGQLIRIGTYKVVFLYRLLPAIVDSNGTKMAPTPLAGLLQLITQATVDRYFKGPEIEAFDSGDGAWELLVENRKVVRDPGPPVVKRLETIPEMLARLRNEYVVRKAQRLADWVEEYRYAGQRLDVPS